MKYLSVFVSWALVAIFLLTVATIEATSRSKERAECYRKMQSVEACPQPAAWEKALRWFISKGER